MMTIWTLRNLEFFVFNVISMIQGNERNCISVTYNLYKIIKIIMKS